MQIYNIIVIKFVLQCMQCVKNIATPTELMKLASLKFVKD